ncbi:uncharacterized protein LOC144598340 [Rhinoraja longicauda]
MSSKPLENIVNFRQLCLGTAKIYRSSLPDRATEKDVKYLKETLGIKLIIDLREPNEVGDAPYLRDAYKRVVVREVELESMKTNCTTGQFLIKDMPLVHLALGFVSKKYYHLINSLLTDDHKKDLVESCSSQIPKYVMQNIVKRDLKQMYKDFIDNSQTFIYTILKLLSDPNNVPALIHCTAGKDRTGIASALIQSCVGLSRECVIDDYEATTEGLKPNERLGEIHKHYTELQGMTEEFLTSEGETMASTLAYIDEMHGSVQGYLIKCGFNSQEQEKLKKNIMITKPQQQQ